MKNLKIYVNLNGQQIPVEVRNGAEFLDKFLSQNHPGNEDLSVVFEVKTNDGKTVNILFANDESEYVGILVEE